MTSSVTAIARRTAITSTGTPRSTEPVREDHRRDPRQVPGRVDRYLRRPLGRRRQPSGIRAGPLPGMSPTTTTSTANARATKVSRSPRPSASSGVRGGILEMDEPEHRIYRNVLNPYLSPAAVKRWVPFIDEVTRACLDEKIEEGRIDFVDDLANIVPAVLTLAMLGIPLKNWAIYSEPVHASVYTPEHSPDIDQDCRHASADGHGSAQQHDRDPREPRPGSSTGSSRCGSTASPLPTSRSWATSVWSSAAGSTPPPR